MNEGVLPIWCFRLVLLLGGLGITLPTWALSETCESSLHESALYEGLQKLRADQARGKDVLAQEEDFVELIRPGGGGACASVAAFNLIQVLRESLGESRLNPHKTLLQAFANQGELLYGRVTDQQLTALFERLGRSFSEHKITVQSSYRPDREYPAVGKPWDGDGPDLEVESGEAKLLVYDVLDSSSKTLGRHFVLLTRSEQNHIRVFDGNNPTTDYQYQLDRKGPQIELDRVNGAKNPDRTFKLASVFTIQANGSSKKKEKPIVGDAIKVEIDRIAEKLKGSPDFISPVRWRKEGKVVQLAGIDLPHEFGGADLPPSMTLELFEHAGRHSLNLRDIVGGGHVRPLLKSSNREVLDIVRKVAQGDGYVAVAITEATAGSNMRAMRSVAKKVAGGYEISGRKLYNARFEQASHVIIFTQAPGQDKGKLNVFVLPIDYPGLKFEKLNPRGLKGNSFGGVSFENLFIPEKYRIGEDGEGGKIFREHFLYWRLMQSAAAIGNAKEALQMMVERLRSRHAFGGPIGRFTHLQQQLAEDTAKLEMAMSLAREAAKLMDQKRYTDAAPLVAMVKAEGVEFAITAVDHALRAFGAEGYTDATDLMDRLTDLLGLRIADGPTDVLRQEVVRRYYGEDLWELAVGTPVQ